MNAAQILYDQFGITIKMDSSGREIVCGLGRWTHLLRGGDTSAWQEIGRLLDEVEKKHLRRDDRIIVVVDRQTLVLRPEEIPKLLERDPDLYVKALKRGKSEKRMQANERRF